MDHYVKVEEETRKQNKLLESSWITLLCEWQATLLGMKCQCKDLMESENQGFLLGGGREANEGEQKEAWVVRSKAVFQIFQEYQLWICTVKSLKGFLHSFS